MFLNPICWVNNIWNSFAGVLLILSYWQLIVQIKWKKKPFKNKVQLQQLVAFSDNDFLVTPLMLWMYFLFSAPHRITDSQHLKRRLHLSTVHKELSATLLHAKIPLVGLKRNMVSDKLTLLWFSSLCVVLLFIVFHSSRKLLSCLWRLLVTTEKTLFLLFQWYSLCIDLVSFSNKLFKGFSSLDGITLFATCKVRRIFTIKPEPSRVLDDGNVVHHTKGIYAETQAMSKSSFLCTYG